MPMIQPTILPINEYSAMDLDMPVGFHVVSYLSSPIHIRI